MAKKKDEPATAPDNPSADPTAAPAASTASAGTGEGRYRCFKDCQGVIEYRAGKSYWFAANPAPDNFVKE